MKLSRFGAKLTRESGIRQLMDDLGEALSRGGEISMLGGGNPARIPEVEAVFRERMRGMLDAELGELVGRYDAPEGNRAFIEALVALLNDRFGWGIAPRNVALTNGSQTSFFYLFNLVAGAAAGGGRRKILLPLTPEYIGYADVGIEDELFVSSKPSIELQGEDQFKYRIDFDAVERDVHDELGAVCVSRPTNPTSNVLTGDELERLSRFARRKGVPLIVDNAYGTPFPHIIFNDAEPIWDEHIVLTMSLSKLGLPGARTGIVVANEEIVRAVTAMNAILSLAPGGFGPYLALELVRSGEILEISRAIIRPYYEAKCAQALEWIRTGMEGLPYRVHKPEGTFFFWLWLEGSPVPSAELYERLKARGVLVVPGHYFFPGLEGEWPHRSECLRINYSQDDAAVERGIAILAEEAARAYRGG